MKRSNAFQAGWVEVCLNGMWGTIGRENWDDIEASIACEQLGYSPYGIIKFKAMYFRKINVPFVNPSYFRSYRQSSYSKLSTILFQEQFISNWH